MPACLFAAVLTLALPGEGQGQFLLSSNSHNLLDISQYTSSDESDMIPSTADGRSVTRIGSGVFFDNPSVTGVTTSNGAGPDRDAVGTNPLNTFFGPNGTSCYSDPVWIGFPGRLFRLRSPQSGMRPPG